MNKKYYSFETRFISLRDILRQYAKENNIYYELSGGNAFYHFEFLLTPEQLEKINAFIDKQVIWEV
jgi:hypothetical protein